LGMCIYFIHLTDQAYHDSISDHKVMAKTFTPQSIFPLPLPWGGSCVQYSFAPVFVFCSSPSFPHSWPWHPPHPVCPLRTSGSVPEDQVHPPFREPFPNRILVPPCFFSQPVFHSMAEPLSARCFRVGKLYGISRVFSQPFEAHGHTCLFNLFSSQCKGGF